MKTVAIIGAGPVGLAAAAHVLECGMSPVVLEAGPEAGHAIRQWQHVQLFSPWEYNLDKAAAQGHYGFKLDSGLFTTHYDKTSEFAIFVRGYGSDGTTWTPLNW